MGPDSGVELSAATQGHMTPHFFGGSLSSFQFFLDRPNGAWLIVDKLHKNDRDIEIWKCHTVGWNLGTTPPLRVWHPGAAAVARKNPRFSLSPAPSRGVLLFILVDIYKPVFADGKTGGPPCRIVVNRDPLRELRCGARVKTPLCRQSAIHSASRPVQPSGSSALSRPRKCSIIGGYSVRAQSI